MIYRLFLLFFIIPPYLFGETTSHLPLPSLSEEGNWVERPSAKDIGHSFSPLQKDLSVKQFEEYQDFGKVIYRYSDAEELLVKETYALQEDKNYIFYFSEHYFWEDGLLTSTFKKDKQGKILSCQTYSYDSLGFLKEERLYGSLSGKNFASLTIAEDGRPLGDACEFYAIHYVYSSEGQLLLEKEQNGKATRYEYFASTGLLKNKFIYDREHLLIRYYYEYDESGKPCVMICDDGSLEEADNLTGVTERRIVRIHSLNDCVSVAEEKYLDVDTGKEQLLRSLRNTYSPEGLLLRQDVVDANGEERFSTTAEYNARGHAVKMRDPLGNESTFSYDESGNKVREQTGRKSKWTQFQYDDKGQLICLEKKGDCGGYRATHYFYDDQGNQTSQVDELGNTTSFYYDSFGRHVKTEFPEVLNGEGGSECPSIQKKYDIYGNLAAEVDAKGYVTEKIYNARGQEVEILHPDGSKERNEYHLDGTLAKSIGKNGSYTLYFYDCMGRAIRSENYSASSELMGVITGVYNAFHLLSSTDVEGKETVYSYDKAGRELSITELTESGSKRIFLEYDALGYVHKKREWFEGGEEKVAVSVFEHDFLGRVTEQRTETVEGEILRKIRYGYDPDGNRTSTVTYTQKENFNCLHVSFDFLNEPCQSTDAIGQTTVTSLHKVRNSKGQFVYQKVIVDPLGRRTEITLDALGRQELLVCKDAFSKLLSKKESRYDLSGNCVHESYFSIFNGKEKGTFNIYKQFGPLNRLEKFTEQGKGGVWKETTYHYGEFASQCCTVRPDGTKLFYDYDSLGRVSHYRDSEKTFHYEYFYDICHRVVAVKDHIHGITSYRCYDSFGRVTKDHLSNGLSLQSLYDHMGRRKQLVLPDDSSITYDYNATDLKEIHRLSASKEETYSHKFLEHDWSGNLLKEELIDGESQALMTWDPLGRLKEVRSSFWSLQVPDSGFDGQGNLIRQKIEDYLGSIDCSYEYDSLSQISKEEGIAEHHYSCDSLQNIREKDFQQQQVNDLNQLQIDGQYTYSYDLNGNLVKKSDGVRGTDYSYDGLGRLIEVQERNHLKVRYLYDAFNRRLKKSLYQWQAESNSWLLIGELRFFYDGKKEIGAADEEGNIVELRVLGKGTGSEIGTAVAFELDEKVYMPRYDQRGSITCLVDPLSKRVVEAYRYSAFGEEQIYDANKDRVESSPLGNPWRFSSKRYDEETGFLYFGGRHYDPHLGRWTTPDPTGFSDGPNLYAYVHNKPLTAIDLYGHFAVSQILKNAANVGLDFVHNLLEFGTSSTKHVMTSLGSILDQIRFDVTGTGYLYNALFDDMKVDQGVVGAGEISSKLRVTFINGINSHLKDCISAAKLISRCHGNVNVHYLCNQSVGLVGDVINCFFVKMDMKPKSCFELASKWKQLIEDIGGVESGGKILHYSHSQGGMITDCAREFLSSEERKLIEVRTIGSPKLLHEGDFAKVTNYISVRDGVPMMDIPAYFHSDPFGDLRGCFLPGSSNVVFLGSWYDGWPLVDHTMGGETYQKIVMALGEKFIEEYGTIPW